MSNPSREEVIANRTRQEVLFGKDVTLPEICMWIRAGVNGSGEPWNERDVRATICFLRERLRVWTGSVSRQSESFDESMKKMVEATIAEVIAYGHNF
jgi:hypothetical protein